LRLREDWAISDMMHIDASEALGWFEAVEADT